MDSLYSPQFSSSGASTPSLSLSQRSPSSGFNTPDIEKFVSFENIASELSHLAANDRFILVVGGLGYIGSHTVLELLKEGHNVAIVDDLSNSYLGVYERLKVLSAEHYSALGQAPPALRIHEVDYRSSAMREILTDYAIQGGPQPRSRISGVIHFAAFKSVEESISQPLRYYQNNVCGMVDFLATLQDFNIKNFVFSSSATIYGAIANKGEPLREEDCVHETENYVDATGQEREVEQGVYGLTSPYGRTKWMCEAILADFAKADPTWRITALRYFNPVGCHESGYLGELPRQKPTNLMPVIANVLKGSSPILNIFGTDWETNDGTAVRDFIHVVDLAQGHVAALKAAGEGKVPHAFRTYNLGSGNGHSVQEVVDSIAKASSRTIPVNRTGRRDGDVGFCVAQVHRAEAELGWKTKKSLDDCATDLWNFTAAQMRSPSTNELPPMKVSATSTTQKQKKPSNLPQIRLQSTKEENHAEHAFGPFLPSICAHPSCKTQSPSSSPRQHQIRSLSLKQKPQELKTKSQVVCSIQEVVVDYADGEDLPAHFDQVSVR